MQRHGGNGEAHRVLFPCLPWPDLRTGRPPRAALGWSRLLLRYRPAAVAVGCSAHHRWKHGLSSGRHLGRELHAHVPAPPLLATRCIAGGRMAILQPVLTWPACPSSEVSRQGPVRSRQSAAQRTAPPVPLSQQLAATPNQPQRPSCPLVACAHRSAARGTPLPDNTKQRRLDLGGQWRRKGTRARGGGRSRGS